MLAARPASAQNALRGKRLYLDAARIVGSGVSCIDCHGGLPGGVFGIGRAANDPGLIQYAVGAVPAMQPLRGRLTAEDVADLAAYIGDPGVDSPGLQLTTHSPDGMGGRPDRIEFGAVEVGGDSGVATLRITSAGALPVTLTGAPEVLNDDAMAFAIDDTSCRAGMAMAPGASCTVDVVMRPVAAADFLAARLVVAHDWVYGIAAVALLGSSTPPALPAPPPPPGPQGCSTAGGGTGVLLVFALAGAAGVNRRRRPRACKT